MAVSTRPRIPHSLDPGSNKVATLVPHAGDFQFFGDWASPREREFQSAAPTLTGMETPSRERNLSNQRLGSVDGSPLPLPREIRPSSESTPTSEQSYFTKTPKVLRAKPWEYEQNVGNQEELSGWLLKQSRRGAWNLRWFRLQASFLLRQSRAGWCHRSSP